MQTNELLLVEYRRNRPGWGLDAAALIVGLEQEHFVFDAAGQAPDLKTTKNFFKELCELGYRPSATDDDGDPLAVNLDVYRGYVSIKNDLCTHIVEIAFPPLKNSDQIFSLYSSTMSDVIRALSSCGLKIAEGSALLRMPESLCLIPGYPRGPWLANRDLPPGDPRLVVRYFTSMMCATQIHMNILDSTFFENLQRYYAMEFVFPLLFSNGTNYNGYHAYCVRPLVWKSNFSETYLACGYPHNIPTAKDKYIEMSNHDDFQRDYSFLSPRATGSVEFRSTCSQNSIEDILEIISLRIAVAQMVSSQHSIAIDSPKAFYELCYTGKITDNSHIRNLAFLRNFDPSMPLEWVSHYQRVLRRIDRIVI